MAQNDGQICLFLRPSQACTCSMSVVPVPSQVSSYSTQPHPHFFRAGNTVVTQNPLEVVVPSPFSCVRLVRSPISLSLSHSEWVRRPRHDDDCGFKVTTISYSLFCLHVLYLGHFPLGGFIFGCTVEFVCFSLVMIIIQEPERASTFRP